jgi:hypothetical protein
MDGIQHIRRLVRRPPSTDPAGEFSQGRVTNDRARPLRPARLPGNQRQHVVTDGKICTDS